MAEAKVLLKIEGMTCAGCAQTIRRALERDEGVREARVSWDSGTAEVSYDPLKTREEQILGNRIFRRQYQYQAEVAAEGDCC